MATLKGAIVEKVRYDFEDSQARETAEEALKQAETVANEITGVETTLVEVQKEIQTVAENTNMAVEKATEAQATAEEAKAIAEEKQPIATRDEIVKECLPDETVEFMKTDLEKVLGIEISKENEGKSFFIMIAEDWGFYDSLKGGKATITNGNLVFETYNNQITGWDFYENEFDYTNKSSSTTHYPGMVAFPLNFA